jgi:phosphatidylinositol glycan class B
LEVAHGLVPQLLEFLKKVNKLTIKNIFYLSLFFHLCAVIFSSGFHHFDEHFQIYEFINLKLGKATAADLPWEFRERIRPWLQPYLYLFVYKALSSVGVISPFVMALVFRLLTSLFGLYALCRFFTLIEQWFTLKRDQVVAWALLNLCWFVPYIQTRTSSESLSISFFLLGMVYFLSTNSKNIRWQSSFYAGVFFGLAYLARSQMAIPVAFLWFWALAVDKRRWSLLLSTAFAIVLMNIVGVAIDSLGYGSFTISIWHYFRTNFLEGIMSSVKQYPVYWYFYWSFTRGIPPVSIVLIVATVFSWWKYRKHPLVWATLPLFLFHSFVGHKELRYIFPVIILSPLFLAFLYRDYKDNFEFLMTRKFIKPLMTFVIGVNFLFLFISSFRAANPSVNFYRYLYNRTDIAKIYAHNESPFVMLGLPISFYKKDNFNVQKFKDFEDINDGTPKYVFFSKGKDIVAMEKNTQCSLEYMTYPRFVINYNVGNWLSRSRVWSLFYCQ